MCTSTFVTDFVIIDVWVWIIPRIANSIWIRSQDLLVGSSKVTVSSIVISLIAAKRQVTPEFASITRQA